MGSFRCSRCGRGRAGWLRRCLVGEGIRCLRTRCRRRGRSVVGLRPRRPYLRAAPWTRRRVHLTRSRDLGSSSRCSFLIDRRGIAAVATGYPEQIRTKPKSASQRIAGRPSQGGLARTSMGALDGCSSGPRRVGASVRSATSTRQLRKGVGRQCGSAMRAGADCLTLGAESLICQCSGRCIQPDSAHCMLTHPSRATPRRGKGGFD